jgi:hypothetical protein
MAGPWNGPGSPVEGRRVSGSLPHTGPQLGQVELRTRDQDGQIAMEIQTRERAAGLSFPALQQIGLIRRTQSYTWAEMLENRGTAGRRTSSGAGHRRVLARRHLGEGFRAPALPVRPPHRRADLEARPSSRQRPLGGGLAARARALRQWRRVPQPRFRSTVERLGARNSLIHAGRPQTNGNLEALHKIILDESWRPPFARYLHGRFHRP